jgi:hypothetical protein
MTLRWAAVFVTLILLFIIDEGDDDPYKHA